MSECKTINCPTCGFQLDETFVEQRCPRCQTILESKFVCGSCHNCGETVLGEESKKTNQNLLTKLFSIFTSPKQPLS